MGFSAVYVNATIGRPDLTQPLRPPRSYIVGWDLAACPFSPPLLCLSSPRRPPNQPTSPPLLFSLSPPPPLFPAFASDQCPEGFVAISIKGGNQGSLRILSVENVGEAFNQQVDDWWRGRGVLKCGNDSVKNARSGEKMLGWRLHFVVALGLTLYRLVPQVTRLRYTPRRLLVHPTHNTLFVAEADHAAIPLAQRADLHKRAEEQNVALMVGRRGGEGKGKRAAEGNRWTRVWEERAVIRCCGAHGHLPTPSAMPLTSILSRPPLLPPSPPLLPLTSLPPFPSSPSGY